MPERFLFIPIRVTQLHAFGFVKLTIVLLVFQCVFDPLIPAAAHSFAPTATLISYVEDEAEGEDDVEAYSGICGVPLPVRQFKLFRYNCNAPSIPSSKVITFR